MVPTLSADAVDCSVESAISSTGEAVEPYGNVAQKIVYVLKE